MKKAYLTVLISLSVIVLSWFLPWLYSLLLPVGDSDPFVAYSPVSRSLIVSESGGGKDKVIYAADAEGNPTGETFTREQRDSLLPQIYFTQLMARAAMPDTVDGKETSMQNIRYNQWVFSSIPHDVNRVFPDVYLIMESMPERIDLEDPDEVFRFRGGRVEFIDIATNTVNEQRTRRFTEIFRDRGFALPMRSFSANITSRKAYDNGYLMVDANGDIYHLKQQAGRPYMMKLRKPGELKAAHVFVMENADNRFLGFMTDTDNRLYAIEQNGYGIVEMPVGTFNPETERISVVKNMFNIVFRISGDDGSRWAVVDADTYKPLARYERPRTPAFSQKAEGYIFPFALSFTSTSDCLAKPRLDFVSWRAVFLNVILAVIVIAVGRRRRTPAARAVWGALTLVFGIFAFIPFVLIRTN